MPTRDFSSVRLVIKTHGSHRNLDATLDWLLRWVLSASKDVQWACLTLNCTEDLSLLLALLR